MSAKRGFEVKRNFITDPTVEYTDMMQTISHLSKEDASAELLKKEYLHSNLSGIESENLRIARIATIDKSDLALLPIRSQSNGRSHEESNYYNMVNQVVASQRSIRKNNFENMFKLANYLEVNEIKEKILPPISQRITPVQMGDNQAMSFRKVTNRALL